VIGPALVIGSALGYAYSDIMVQLFPGLQLNLIAFAMVATVAMLSHFFWVKPASSCACRKITPILNSV
jgi:hypothetical protein